MALKTFLTKLDAEQLARYRILEARDQAIRLLPGAYSRDEIERHFIGYWQFIEDLALATGLDNTRDWEILCGTGELIYTGGD